MNRERAETYLRVLAEAEFRRTTSQPWGNAQRAGYAATDSRAAGWRRPPTSGRPATPSGWAARCSTWPTRLPPPTRRRRRRPGRRGIPGLLPGLAGGAAWRYPRRGGVPGRAGRPAGHRRPPGPGARRGRGGVHRRRPPPARRRAAPRSRRPRPRRRLGDQRRVPAVDLAAGRPRRARPSRHRRHPRRRSPPPPAASPPPRCATLAPPSATSAPWGSAPSSCGGPGRWPPAPRTTWPTPPPPATCWPCSTASSLPSASPLPADRQLSSCRFAPVAPPPLLGPAGVRQTTRNPRQTGYRHHHIRSLPGP